MLSGSFKKNQQNFSGKNDATKVKKHKIKSKRTQK